MPPGPYADWSCPAVSSADQPSQEALGCISCYLPSTKQAQNGRFGNLGEWSPFPSPSSPQMGSSTPSLGGHCAVGGGIRPCKAHPRAEALRLAPGPYGALGPGMAGAGFGLSLSAPVFRENGGLNPDRCGPGDQGTLTWFLRPTSLLGLPQEALLDSSLPRTPGNQGHRAPPITSLGSSQMQ